MRSYPGTRALIQRTALAVFVLMWPVHARAAVFFDTYINGNMTDREGGLSVAVGNVLNSTADIDQGIGIVPSEDFILESLDITISIFPGSDPLNNGVDLMLTSAIVGGAPIGILETFHFETDSVFDSNLDTDNLPMTSVNSLFNPTLLKDTEYWILVSAEGPDALLAWSNRNSIAGGPPTAISTNGSPWAVFEEGRPVPLVRLNGRAVVPEPMTLFLFGGGMAGALMRRRDSRMTGREI